MSDSEKPKKRQLIQPRTLKGFRDYLPETMIPREQLIQTAREVYRSFGFGPIDTPTLEYLEILTGKGSEETDRQLYKFQDHGGRDVGMRFDLTVPLAEFELDQSLKHAQAELATEPDGLIIDAIYAHSLHDQVGS